MRLWHYKLIPLLPRQQILGQHSECCGMRGKGWGVSHSTVNYVWKYRYNRLFLFHKSLMLEMQSRGYNVEPLWFDNTYRGKLLGFDVSNFTYVSGTVGLEYPEHNEAYYQECLDNLKAKGVVINGS